MFMYVLLLLLALSNSSSKTLESTSTSTSTSKSNCNFKTLESPNHRKHTVSITEFGAVGDGITLNTKAFQNAVFYIKSFSDDGGARLVVPRGQWLTGSFEVTSHLTLWLEEGAVVIGSKDSEDWPIVEALASYGRGRELPGRRHRSLVYGYNLTDVIITGEGGKIDGQGGVWWEWFHKKKLNYTRPHLVELMYCREVLISNLIFLNSPFWTIHPVYSSKVVVRNVTIRAPHESPNTDGIDPDSSNDVCIEDCYISSGDDLIAIKSGWDEYGISFARPSTNIHIYRLHGETQSSGITIGSEMSGGVSGVYAEDLFFYNTNAGVTIRTSPGRGGYVRNVYLSRITLTGVTTAIWFNGKYGQHPDERYNPKALPEIKNVTIRDVLGENITVAGLMEGIQGDEFNDICLYNISLKVNTESPWKCRYVRGYSKLVSPTPCAPLGESIAPEHDSSCYHLTSQL